MKKQSALVLLAVLMTILVIGFVAIKDKRSENSQTKSEDIAKGEGQVSYMHVYDKAILMGEGSGVNFHVPSAGFYGHGLHIETFEEGARVFIEPVEDFIPERAAEFITLSLETTNEFDDDLILQKLSYSRFPENTIDGSYARDNGTLITINEQDYFIFETRENVVSKVALTRIDERLVTVRMSYTTSESEASISADTNNDAIFRKLLGELKVGG